MGWFSKTVKKVTKGAKKAWDGVAGDVVVGGLTGLAGLGVKHHWFQDAFKSLTGQAAAEKMAKSQERLANAMTAQPTANASMVAEAATEQNVAKRAEESTQNAKKRRMGWSSTVNSALGSSGGIGGRATLG